MAVALKTDGFALLPLFGVQAHTIQEAKSLGVTVEQPSVGNFYVKHGGHSFGVVQIKGQAITLAKAGQLGPASKESFQHQFESYLKAAIQAAKSSGAVPTPAAFVDPMPKGDVSADSSEFVKTIAQTKAKVDALVTGSGTPCALKEATELYQPVHGTSSGSIYLTVALMDGMNIAARAQAGKLSLRGEGPKLNSYLGALNDLGFTFKPKENYVSVHFEIGDDALLLKTFGAVLGRLGFTNIKQAGEIINIKGKGK